jgi:hypothetical protein
MVSAMSVKKFLTVLPSTNLTYSHPDIINIHRMEIIHCEKRQFARAWSAMYIHVLVHNTAKQIFVC